MSDNFLRHANISVIGEIQISSTIIISMGSVKGSNLFSIPGTGEFYERGKLNVASVKYTLYTEVRVLDF